jgi:hypothetical protein
MIFFHMFDVLERDYRSIEQFFYNIAGFEKKFNQME